MTPHCAKAPPPTLRPPGSGPAAVRSGVDAPTRVVVGVDEDPASWEALRFGVAEAARRGGEVLVVHCWRRPGRWVLPTSFDPPGPEDGPIGLTGVVDAVLAERVGAGEPAVTVIARSVEGEAATELWRLARGAALLVVGARHHDVLLGSVSHFLSGHPPCPLVVVPDPTT